jgi:long-subunit fatty acid transport protein
VYGQSIRRLVSYEGYTGEHAFSIGGNYSNKLFFGATLGISSLKYTSHFEHLESTDIALPSKFKNFTYTDHYQNSGTGYSLKLGAIIKPIESLRIGLAFHSPTLYRISEYFYENITSNFTDGGHYEFSDDPQRFSYALTTPFRALAGVAVQIKKIALLSADYEFVDYGIARFSETGDNYDYSDKNMNIKNNLQSVSNIRLGGELRLNKLYLRSGYGYYGKAFKPGDYNDNLDYRSISLGAGFREQNISIDFAYTNYKYSQTSVLYPLDSSFNPSTVNFGLKNIQNMFTVTLGYKFGY